MQHDTAPAAAQLSYVPRVFLSRMQATRATCWGGETVTAEEQAPAEALLHACCVRVLAAGVPMMSVRDAMYDAMFNDSNPYGIQRSRILVDIVHVGDYGASVYASFLAWALRHHMTRSMLHHRCVKCCCAMQARSIAAAPQSAGPHTHGPHREEAARL